MTMKKKARTMNEESGTYFAVNGLPAIIENADAGVKKSASERKKLLLLLLLLVARKRRRVLESAEMVTPQDEVALPRELKPQTVAAYKVQPPLHQRCSFATSTSSFGATHFFFRLNFTSKEKNTHKQPQVPTLNV